MSFSDIYNSKKNNEKKDRRRKNLARMRREIFPKVFIV